MSHEDLPILIEGDHDSENEVDDDWTEIDEDHQLEIACLFCLKANKNMEISIEHLKVSHDIDLANLKHKFSMNFYSYIKMINYIRTHSPTDKEFLLVDDKSWNDEKYLKPVNSEDPWLMFDFDDIEIELNHCQEEKYTENMIKILQEELIHKNLLLQQAAIDIENMKKSFKIILEKEEKEIDQLTRTLNNDVQCVGNLALQNDEGYFSSYSHYGIHHDMLTDDVRTESYRDAILKNVDTFKDKIVLDLGCGTSILSMFSSKAGANTVIGIDNSDIIYQAMDIVRKNNFKNIKLVKGRIEDTELPIDKVDIIVSEWMGYFLLFEGMLDSVIYTRNRHLKPNGILLPNRCNISIVGYGDIDRYNGFIDYWKDVYSFDMSCMKTEVLKEATIEICKPEFVLTTANIIADFNLMTVDTNCPNFSYKFNLNVIKSGKLTSFVGYFDTFFDLPIKVEFSTSPNCKSTHWKQIVFYMKSVVVVEKGDIINGKFICQRNVKDVRSLSITIEIFGGVFKYNLN